MSERFTPNEGFFDSVDRRYHTLQLKNRVVSQSVSILNTATLIPITPISDRRGIIMYNNSDSIIYIGGIDVSTVNGYPVSPGDSFRIDVDDNVKIYGISAVSGKDLRLLEGA